MTSFPFWLFPLLLLIAYIATVLLVPVNIRFSKKHEFISVPNERSIHKQPMPTAGGLSIGIVLVCLQIIIGLFNLSQEFGKYLLALGGISVVIIIVGMLDDRFHLRVRYKFLGQIIVAVLMFLAGYRVCYLTNPLGADFQLTWMSLPVTLIWFLITMNAINLIDGLDGLAAGITCIVSVVLAVIGFLGHNPPVLVLTALLLGTNLAFLKYNFFPAKIFMGDTGSLLLGLNIGAVATAGNATFKGITTMTLMVPVIALAIPLLDTLLAVVRRSLRHESIFKADKSHLHHYLLRLGLSQSSIALLIYFITALFGLAAIGFYFSSNKILFSLLVLLMAVLIILGYYLIHKGQKL
ncbi:MAG TPA: MraY family glycosyltransferase [Candidatus Cloacimonadota bacterium]|nr:MraY family glycosyltransferase [Candidatus Cloacimonadota bacterium]HOV17320.1 MraY family glycosyltransferase [Candidatus Cloacimonadota bacterium]HQL14432.1 MraY family glycosyltransferase [Candidatus Cloacimonadota bacterium]